MSSRKDRKNTLAKISHFRIDDLLVQPEQLTVLRGEQTIALEQRMMELLVTLAEHAGETLSPEFLLIAIWRGTFYGDNPVNKTMSLLRSRIGDDSKSPRYIETIRKRGYRLIAPVSLPKDYRRNPVAEECWTSGSPYVGLAAFDAMHSEVFCGRSQAIADLLKAMRRQLEQQRRFLLLVGPSGCGKTSLLRAGAIPYLTRPGGFDGLQAASVAYCDLVTAPRDDAILVLAAGLARWSLDGRPILPPMPTEALADLLRDKPGTILPMIDASWQHNAPELAVKAGAAHVLVVIDHAEVLADKDVKPTARAFERVLCALCACPHVLVAMVVRSDGYPGLIEAMPALVDLKAGDGHMDVAVPRAGEIAEIIRGPAWRANLSFEQDPVSLARLDDVLRDAATAQPDALPLLQHMLQSLYEHRGRHDLLTFEAYREIGELSGAITHRAETTFQALPADRRTRLNKLFEHMISLHLDTDAIGGRHVATSSLDPMSVELADAFVHARLFVAELGPTGPGYRVAHEALLRQWSRANEWASENRRLLQARARLRRASERWVDAGRRDDHLLNPGRPLHESREAAERFPTELSHDDCAFLAASERIARRRSRIRNVVTTTMAALLLASSLLTYQAYRLKNEAETRRAETLKLSEFMLNDLAGSLKRQGDFELLDRISKKAMELLDQRPLEQLSVRELILRAKTYLSLGGNLKAKGRIAEAGKAFRAADLAATAAADRAPNDLAVLNESGQTAFWLGDFQHTLGNQQAARQAWQRYLRIADRLVRAAPDNPDWLMEQSYALNNLGTLESEAGRRTEAMRLFSASLRLKERAVARVPENMDFLKDLTDTRSWVTKLHEDSGALVEARRGHADQIKTLREVINRFPNAKAWRRWLGNALVRSAELASVTGRPEQAHADIEEAVSILTQIGTGPDIDLAWRRDLAYALMVRADTCAVPGAAQHAPPEYSTALAIIDALADRDGAPYEWKRLKWTIRLKHAIALAPAPDSRSTVEHALAELDILRRVHPSDLTGGIVLADALIAAGGYFSSLGDRRAAMVTWQRATRTVSTDGGAPDSLYATAHWTNAQCLMGHADEVRTNVRWLAAAGYSWIVPECRMASAHAGIDPVLASH